MRKLLLVLAIGLFFVGLEANKKNRRSPVVTNNRKRVVQQQGNVQKSELRRAIDEVYNVEFRFEGEEKKPQPVQTPVNQEIIRRQIKEDLDEIKNRVINYLHDINKVSQEINSSVNLFHGYLDKIELVLKKQEDQSQKIAELAGIVNRLKKDSYVLEKGFFEKTGSKLDSVSTRKVIKGTLIGLSIMAAIFIIHGAIKQVNKSSFITI